MGLKEYFGNIKKAAAAFSGGVDSSYLIYAAKEYGTDITAYYVKTAFQPSFEYDDAVRLAGDVGVRMKTIELDILSDETIAKNSADRCYFCKRTILRAVKTAAAADGYDILLEGTNASDDVSDRPGMRAIKELSVLSPLRECGLSKSDIRKLSKEAGLFTYDKPSYSCLATRIMNGAYITADKLSRIERAEHALIDLGFSDMRVRLFGENAVLQFTKGDIKRAFSSYETIRERISELFGTVSIDIKERDIKL